MDHLNGKTELLKQTHILKDHLNGKIELLKQIHIQVDFPFQWNGMVETNGAFFSSIVYFLCFFTFTKRIKIKKRNVKKMLTEVHTNYSLYI